MGATLFWIAEIAARWIYSKPDRFRQNYNGKVGDVYNAEKIEIRQELGFNSGIEPDLTPRFELVATLIDRYPQFSTLRKALDTLFPTKFRRGVLLVVIPGYAEDLHQCFVLRCALREFLERYSEDARWSYLKRLPWRGSQVIDLLQSAADTMGLPPSLGQDEIETRVAGWPQHLCFSHTVDKSDWEFDSGALMRAWCKYFESGNLGNNSKRLIVAFLCVELPDKVNTNIHPLELFVDELGTNSKLNILVLPQLQKVRRRELEDWTGEAARYLGEDYFEGALLEIPGRVFKVDQPRCFRDLYADVRSELGYLKTDRPKFTVAGPR